MTVWFMVLASFCARAESELPLVVHLRRQLLYVYVMADELAGLQATADDQMLYVYVMVDELACRQQQRI